VSCSDYLDGWPSTVSSTSRLTRTCTGEDSPFHPFLPVGDGVAIVFPLWVISLPLRVGSHVHRKAANAVDHRSGRTHIIGQGRWSRFCFSASRLRLRACAQSPVRTVGGLSS